MIQPTSVDGSVPARHLLDIAGDTAARAGHPLWVMVLQRPSGRVEVVVCQDGFDPLGWTAPPDCHGFGMVGTGRVRPLRESVELPASVAGGRAGGVRMACLVWRQAPVAWHMVLPDGSLFEEIPEEGRVLDILRRVLGVPTPPPPAGLEGLFVAAWVTAIVAAGRPGRPLSWPAALALHPVMDGIGGDLDVRAQEAVVRLAGVGSSWEGLRVAAAAGPAVPGLPRPELAAWMDAGMFARWVLDGLHDPDDLLERARPHLQPVAARRLAHFIRPVP